MSGIPERVWKLKLPCHVDNAIMKHMETIIKKIDRNQIDQEIMEEAGSILKNGGLVAFPTETVYGLGANALDEEAAKKTYAAKGRPSDNPLIVHIARLEDLGAIVESVPLIVDEIAAHFWPAFSCLRNRLRMSDGHWRCCAGQMEDQVWKELPCSR